MLIKQQVAQKKEAAMQEESNHPYRTDDRRNI